MRTPQTYRWVKTDGKGKTVATKYPKQHIMRDAALAEMCMKQQIELCLLVSSLVANEENFELLKKTHNELIDSLVKMNLERE